MPILGLELGERAAFEVKFVGSVCYSGPLSSMQTGMIHTPTRAECFSAGSALGTLQVSTGCKLQHGHDAAAGEEFCVIQCTYVGVQNVGWIPDYLGDGLFCKFCKHD